MRNKAERDKQAKRKVLLEELAEKFRHLERDYPGLSATVEIDERIPLLAKAYLLRRLRRIGETLENGTFFHANL